MNGEQAVLIVMLIFAAGMGYLIGNAIGESAKVEDLAKRVKQLELEGLHDAVDRFAESRGGSGETPEK